MAAPIVAAAATNIVDNMQKNAQIKRQGKEERKTQKQAANLELRNKIVDVMLEDEDTRKAMADTVRQGGSFAIQAAKVTGIALLAGVGVYFVYKGIKSIATIVSEKKELNKIVGDYDKKELSLSPTDISRMTEKIYAAFVDGIWGYKYADIVDVLSKVQNKADWAALCENFGNKPVKRNDESSEKHNLVWFLNDTYLTSTKKEYEKILTDKGIEKPLGSLSGGWRKRKKKKGKAIATATSAVVKDTSEGKKKLRIRPLFRRKKNKELKPVATTDLNVVTQRIETV